MSALSVLFLILPLPLLFLIHKTEEAFVEHKWIISHHGELANRFPRLKPFIDHWAGLTTKGFAIATIEEMIVVVFITAYVLVKGPGGLQIWVATFVAFTLHMFIHIVLAFATKGYVPGLVTTVAIMPYCYMGMQSIWHNMDGEEIALWTITGIILAVVNIRFAHKIGN